MAENEGNDGNVNGYDGHRWENATRGLHNFTDVMFGIAIRYLPQTPYRSQNISFLPLCCAQARPDEIGRSKARRFQNFAATVIAVFNNLYCVPPESSIPVV